MRNFLIWLLLAIAALIALDALFGVLFGRYIESHILPGDYEMTDHVVRNFDEDILVLGSSVALNSINTKTLEDSLGVSAFNGAANGQTFPFFLTMLKAVMQQQKKPESIILGLTPNNLTDTGKGTRYNFLAPYYGRGIADVDSVFAGGDKAERLFLNSNLYRLNRIWFRIFLYNFVSAGIKGENGFIAKPVPPMFPERQPQGVIAAISDERHSQLDEFAAICHKNNISLMVVLTPRCIIETDGTEKALKDSLRGIFGRYGYTVYDDVSMSPFDRDSTLFYDATHINIDGAKIYTDTIINRLKYQD